MFSLKPHVQYRVGRLIGCLSNNPIASLLGRLNDFVVFELRLKCFLWA
jgi:hypothetical protein